MSKKLDQAEADEVALRGGRSLRVAEAGEVVEIRAASGQLELRIRLTDEGPVLQMEAVRMQLRASEAVEIESKRVDIKTEGDLTIDAKGEVRVVGAMIYLN